MSRGEVVQRDGGKQKECEEVFQRLLTFDPNTLAYPSRRAEKHPVGPPYFGRASAPG